MSPDFKAMTAGQIYISSQGKQWGPYSLKEVNFLLTKGSFQLSDWAWAEHIAKWIPVGEVMGSPEQSVGQQGNHPSTQQAKCVQHPKPCENQVEKPVVHLDAGSTPWWQKSAFRNLLVGAVGVLMLLLFLGWGKGDADYSALERRDGIAFEPGSSKPFHGRAISHYPNGKPMYKANFKRGLEESRTVSWYANGQKQSEATMREGKFHGVVNYWYDDGKMMAHYTYENGKVIHRKDWDPDGGAYKRE